MHAQTLNALLVEMEESMPGTLEVTDDFSQLDQCEHMLVYLTRPLVSLELRAFAFGRPDAAQRSSGVVETFWQVTLGAIRPSGAHLQAK